MEGSQNPNTPPKSPRSRSPSPPPPFEFEATTPTPPRPRPQRVAPEAVGGSQILKTPWEVLAELSSSPPRSSDHHQGGIQRGISAARALGKSVIVTNKDMPGIKKRKSPTIKDPPSGEPKCEECGKLFTSWKAAFGHMRSHPNRTHRGFFRPPTFSSSSSSATNLVQQGEGSSSAAADNMSQEARVLAFDLNIEAPVPEDEEGEAGGSSHAVTVPAPAADVIEEQPANQVPQRVPASIEEQSEDQAPKEVPAAIEEQPHEDKERKGKGLDLNKFP